jgi:hypothetical protein
MSNTVKYALLTGAFFLVLFTVSVGKPGLPVTLKADEPAYYLMALSLVEDQDLECKAEDYQRAFDGYPYLPTENLILMTDSQSDIIRFGKPYIYSLLAAPLAGLFGANGLVALNALLFCLMVAMGTQYLRQFNTDGQAALFSTAFFFLSPTFHYVFWLQPEILNMASAMGCLFFAFHTFSPPRSGGLLSSWRHHLFSDRSAPVWSAAILALGTYNKPILALIGLPVLFLFFRRQGRKAVLVWLVAAVLAMGAIAGGAVLLTGHPTPYLGVVRTGLKIEDPAAMESVVDQAFGLISARSTTANTWSWIFRVPTQEPREFLQNLGYFFWGRHTGLFLYFPFALACLGLFVRHQRRSLERWTVVAAIASVALFFLLFIPFNWHGGGGFIGNRYFIMAYPAFLFLVTSLKPLWVMPSSAALAGIFLGSILFTPFGAPVPQPTLQAHVRGGLFRLFPQELSLRLTVPGYNYMAQPKVMFIGRKDVFHTHRPEKRREWIDGATLQRTPLIGQLDSTTAWIYGATRTDVLVMTEHPIEGLLFEVATWVPDNDIRLEIGGDVNELVFEDAQTPEQRARIVELRPQEVAKYHFEQGKRFLVYKMQIEPRTGRRVVDRKDPTGIFYLGAQLRFLGRRDQLSQPEHYRVEWLSSAAPATVQSGAEFEIPVAVRNNGATPLDSSAALGVFLSYHWLDSRGQSVVFDGRRTPLGPTIEPDEEADVTMQIEAPDRPGHYLLVLDAVREHVAWFSQRGGETREIAIQVTPGASG